MSRTIILLLSILISNLGHAATIRYISDKLEVPLRSGESLKHKIVVMLTVGQPVEVLKNNTQTGYSKVKLNTGIEGWVLTRFLMAKPSAANRLESAEKKIARLEIERTKLKEEIKNLQKSRGQSNTEADSLTQENIRLQQEIAQIRKNASNTLAIADENDELKARIINLERDLQTIEQEKLRISDRAARDWFIYGAGVAIFGIFLGLLISKFRLKPKSNWNTL